MLTWSFPLVSSEGCELQLAWGTTSLPIKVAVQPSRPSSASVRTAFAPYVGNYQLTFETKESGGQPIRTQVRLFIRDGVLRGQFADAPPNMDDEFELVPDGNNSFRAIYYREGKRFEEDRETLIVFEMRDNRAVSLEMRFEGDVWGRGQRADSGGFE